MKKETGILSNRLAEELLSTVEEGRQAIFFLNRRGYTYFFRCNSCHYELYCPQCSVPLTYHKSKGKLLCHYCGYQEDPKKVCPNCGSTDVGFVGFGTEHIEEDLARRFPHIRFARLDADVTAKKNMLSQVLGGLREGGGGCPAGNPDGGQGAELSQAQTGGDHPGGHRPQPPGFPGPGEDLRPHPAGGRPGGSVSSRREGDHPDFPTSEPRHPLCPAERQAGFYPAGTGPQGGSGFSSIQPPSALRLPGQGSPSRWKKLPKRLPGLYPTVIRGWKSLGRVPAPWKSWQATTGIRYSSGVRMSVPSCIWAASSSRRVKGFGESIWRSTWTPRLCSRLSKP
jgi:hypothetical protein